MQKSAKQIIIVGLIGLLAFIMTACSGSNVADPSSSEVAASVNGKPISMKEVEDLLNQQMQGQQAQLSKLELSQARLQILDNLIQKEVLFQRAEKENLLPTEDEITKYINDQIQQRGITEDALEAELKKNNQTKASLREDTRKLLAIQKLQDRITNKVKNPSDKIVEDFFNSNKEAFVRPRGVQLAVITVDPKENKGLVDDAKTDADAKLKADAIFQQLKTGADFATVARARSEDQYGPRGGDLGFAAEDDLKGKGFPDDLVGKFFSMDIGSYTEPVKVPGAYYIFKLVGRQNQAENETLQTPGVKERITTEIVNQQKQLLVAALQVAAMSDAKIDNLLAKRILEDPELSNILRPAKQPGQTPAATPTPAPSATPTPSAPAKPDAKSSPTPSK